MSSIHKALFVQLSSTFQLCSFQPGISFWKKVKFYSCQGQNSNCNDLESKTAAKEGQFYIKWQSSFENCSEYTNLLFIFFQFRQMCWSKTVSFSWLWSHKNFTLKAEKASSIFFHFPRKLFIYQSIPSLTTPGKLSGIFVDRANSPPQWHKECQKPRAVRQKSHARTPAPGQLFSKLQQKKKQNMRQNT